MYIYIYVYVSFILMLMLFLVAERWILGASFLAQAVTAEDTFAFGSGTKPYTAPCQCWLPMGRNPKELKMFIDVDRFS